MAKRKRLIDQARESPAVPFGKGGLSWHVRLRKRDPDLMKQIDDLIDCYNTGELEDRFPSNKSLWVWMRERGLPQNVSASAFATYIRGRADGPK